MLTRKKETERLAGEIAAGEAEIEGARQLKQLLVGTGADFEDAVAKALRELGLEVVPGPHPRADLLVTDGTRIAAVEAKGIEGAAKEDYVRQVRMWMPEVDAALAPSSDETEDPLLNKYTEQLQKLNLEALDRNADCKGILVLGTFRLLPLDQRTQADFVENVIQVITRQDICALTGLQLFGLIIMTRSEPSLKESIRTALFATRGILNLAKDWRQFLEATSAVAGPASA